MTVRGHFIAVLAFAALLLAGGCGDRENEQLTVETDDPFFVQGRQLQKQGRNPEALTAFLKVIDKRGERAAAESHLEAGVIFLNHTKDPVEAYHHFRKYLELQPNSKQAPLVRGLVETARREFAKTIPGRPLDDQSVRLQADEELSKLRRENEELRAELAVLRGGGGVPVNRTARMINVPIQPPSGPVVVPTASVASASAAKAPDRSSISPITPAPAAARAAAPTSPVPSNLPGKSAVPPRTTTAAARGMTHTVAAKETLFGLSKKYNVRMEELAAANGLPSVNAPLKLGTVLKIPSSSGR